jgi:glyoxylase I family protein
MDNRLVVPNRLGIQGLSHTGFDVEDIDRTIAFYTSVLGAHLQWRGTTPWGGGIIKLYLGDLGLSILERKKGSPKPDIPWPIHFGLRQDPELVDQCIAHIKSKGVEVDGPHGHAEEGQNLSWFILDPDGYRVEIEAHMPTIEDAVAILERDQGQQKPHMNTYKGPNALPLLKAQLAQKQLDLAVPTTD